MYSMQEVKSDVIKTGVESRVILEIPDIYYFVFLYSLSTGISCWNPAFDVTPAELITGGIVTESGVFKPAELYEMIKIVKDT